MSFFIITAEFTNNSPNVVISPGIDFSAIDNNFIAKVTGVELPFSVLSGTEVDINANPTTSQITLDRPYTGATQSLSFAMFASSVNLLDLTVALEQNNQSYSEWFTQLDEWLNGNVTGTITITGPTGPQEISTLPSIIAVVDQAGQDFAQLAQLVADAQQAKTDAEAAVGVAETARDDAVTAKNQAETAEGNASASEQNASTSALNAATSESNANTSRVNAQTAESNAQGHETKSQQFAIHPENTDIPGEPAGTRSSLHYAAKSEDFSTDSQGFRDQAETHKDDALTFRNQAEGFKNDSETAKNNAETAETNAEQHETNAGSFASQAEGFKNDAETAKNDTQNLRVIVEAIANFKGIWTDQTGAANIPYTVLHNGNIWILIQNLTDVTTVEPSTDVNTWVSVASTTGSSPDSLALGGETAAEWQEKINDVETLAILAL